MKADKIGNFLVEDILTDIKSVIPDLNMHKKILKEYFDKKLGCKRLFIPFHRATYLVDISMDRAKATQQVETVPTIYGVGYEVHVDSFKKGNVWRIQIARGLSNAAYLVKHDDAKYLMKEMYEVLHGEYKNYASVEPNGILYTFNIDMDELREFVENYVEPSEKVFTEKTPF